MIEPKLEVPAEVREMAEALEAIKSASPSLAGDIEAAKITPESLAGSHDRATPDEPGRHAAPE